MKKESAYPYLTQFLSDKGRAGGKMDKFLRARSRRRLEQLDEVCSNKPFKTRYEEFVKIANSTPCESKSRKGCLYSFAAFAVCVLLAILSALFFKDYLLFFVSPLLLTFALVLFTFAFDNVQTLIAKNKFPLAFAYFNGKLSRDKEQNQDIEVCLEQLQDSIWKFYEDNKDILRQIAEYRCSGIHANVRFSEYPEFAYTLLNHDDRVPFDQDFLTTAYKCLNLDGLQNAAREITSRPDCYKQREIYVKRNSDSTPANGSMIVQILLIAVATLATVFSAIAAPFGFNYTETKALLIKEKARNENKLLQKEYEKELDHYNRTVDSLSNILIVRIYTERISNNSLGNDIEYEYRINNDVVFERGTLAHSSYEGTLEYKGESNYKFDVIVTEDDDIPDVGCSKISMDVDPETLQQGIERTIKTTVHENCRPSNQRYAVFETTLSLRPKTNVVRQPEKKQITEEQVTVGFLDVWDRLDF